MSLPSETAAEHHHLPEPLSIPKSSMISASARSLLSHNLKFTFNPSAIANPHLLHTLLFPKFLTFTPISPKFKTLATRTLNNEPSPAIRPNPSPNVVEILKERGLLESLTSDNLRSVCAGNHPPLKVYCGFDPTAESLHLGNLLRIIVLSWFQRCGYQVVALIGGATGRVGDPSGKSSERPDLDQETLERNMRGIGAILNKILGRFGNDNSFAILNN